MVQMVDPVARPIRKDFRYGDIGLSKMTIVVSNVEKLFKDLEGRIDFRSTTKSVKIPGWGEYRFVFCKDPEGNLIELVTTQKMFLHDGFGGFVWVGISVTDLTRSIAFYQKYAGFDKVFIDIHEGFSTLVDEIAFGEKTKVRSCVLANSEAEGMIELFEVKEPRGRSIPFASRWGDFGYLQVCLNGKQGDDIFRMATYFENEGLEFISGPQLMRDEREGAFFYIKDPDGIPVEFLVFLK